MQLLLSGYLKESFHSTAYAINVYVLPGDNALRLTRWSREDIESGKGQRITLVLVKKSARRDGGVRGVNRRTSGTVSKASGRSRSAKSNDRKGKKSAKTGDDEDGDAEESDDSFVVPDEEEDSMYVDGDVVNIDAGGDRTGKRKDMGGVEQGRKRQRIQSPANTDGDESSESESWTFSLSKKSSSNKNSVKRSRGSLNGAAFGEERASARAAMVPDDLEVIELSD